MNYKLLKHPKLYCMRSGDIRWAVVLAFGSRPGLRVVYCRLFNQQLQDVTMRYQTEDGLAPFVRGWLRRGKLVYGEKAKKQLLAKLLVGSL